MSVDPGSRGWNEHRHMVDMPVWTPLVYSNSWADVGSGWATGAWWKDPFGAIHLRGLIQRAGTSASGETVFTLPAGARPAMQETFAPEGPTLTTVLRLDIAIDGRGLMYMAAAAPYISLSGITFRTA